jgi:Kef-type K+ transport system membrane component KefB
MPGNTDGTPDPDVLRPMEDVSGILLPLFFVVTGLSVNIGAFGQNAILILILVLAIAAIGKLVPGYFAARAGGLDKKDSATVAALVNTRGLTELIALNIGLSSGLLSGQLFSVLVVMAVLTTLMTSPLLSLIKPVTMTPASRGRQDRSAGVRMPL